MTKRLECLLEPADGAPAALERMFAEGGVPATDGQTPPPVDYAPEAARAIAERFGFDVVGPQLS